MPDPSSRLELVKSYVMAPLGFPVLPAEIEAPTPADLEWGLISYFKFVPIKYTQAYQFISSREQVTYHKDIINMYVNSQGSTPALKPERFFYIGVLSMGALQQLGQARFDEFLLGQFLQRPAYDPLKYAVYNTEIDINVGDPYYEEDELRKFTRFIVGGNCTLAVCFGLGYNGVDAVPLRHLDYYSELVKKPYYERLLALRKTGKFNNADFTIDPSLLEDAYKQALEKIKVMNIELGYTTLAIG